MTVSNNLSPGMTISIAGKLYRVESSVKVTVAKGTPFIKTKLRDLNTDQVVEKNFKLNQNINDVTLATRKLEYLYLEGDSYLFLDIANLEQVLVPQDVVGDKANYLKEGVEVEAQFYGDTTFSIELPQFLELMVSKTEHESKHSAASNNGKLAILETGAKIEVPPFIESGDIVKVDTRSNEYIQRV
jgi:elongation factor P